MAFAVKYRTEFTDILGLDWKVEIEEDSYAGAVIPMYCSGSPLTISHLAASDDLYDNSIKGSKADLTIESTNFQWIDLYSTEDLRLRMSIYYNTTLHWRGFVITNNYSEEYNTPKFSVIISASDGLGYLKNYLYKYKTVTEDDTYYQDRRLESQIILDILGKLGITSFTEFVNIYEESMAATTADSPIDQIRIDVDVFRDMYCYEVLEEILKKYNAVIRIIAGQPTIYRPVELAGATVYGRIFTAATVKSSTTLTPAQYISRKGLLTDLRDINGGNLMIQGPAKKITIHQDYGYKDSLIDTWELKSSSFNPTTNTFDDWACSNVSSINETILEEENGLWITAVSVRREANYYASQTFGEYLITTANIFGFSFDYYVYSYNGSALSNVYIDIMIKHVATGKYLEVLDEEDLQWSATEKYITITIATLDNGRSGWVNFARSIPDGLPGDGEIEIKIFNPYCSSSYAFGAAFKNVKFFSTSDLIVSKRKVKYYYPFWSQGLPINLFRKEKVFPTKYQDNPEVIQYDWIKTNSINGKELETEMMLGDVSKSGSGGVNIDNIIEQFAGSLTTVTLNYRVDQVTISASTGGTANITCNGVTKLATWTTDEEGTAEKFVEDWGSSGGDFYLSGVQVSFSGDEIYFTSLIRGAEFTGSTTIENVIPDLAGTVVENSTPAEQDFTYSTDWNTRGGSESKELLSIICDELSNQFSRPKHFLSLPIMENNRFSKTPHVNILGNFQDSSNQISGNNRKFVFNKGSFNVRDREWNIDLNEII